MIGCVCGVCVCVCVWGGGGLRGKEEEGCRAGGPRRHPNAPHQHLPPPSAKNKKTLLNNDRRCRRASTRTSRRAPRARTGSRRTCARRWARRCGSTCRRCRRPRSRRTREGWLQGGRERERGGRGGVERFFLCRARRAAHNECAPEYVVVGRWAHAQKCQNNACVSSRRRAESSVLTGFTIHRCERLFTHRSQSKSALSSPGAPPRPRPSAL